MTKNLIAKFIAGRNNVSILSSVIFSFQPKFFETTNASKSIAYWIYKIF